MAAGIGFLALVLNAIWWRRVCLDGTETVALRGDLLIQRAEAFGLSRRWVRRLDKIRSVGWSRGDGRAPSATYLSRSRDYFEWTLGRALDRESGEFLAAEIKAAVRAAGGDPGGA